MNDVVETVTMSLEKYEEMKKTISDLEDAKKENEMSRTKLQIEIGKRSKYLKEELGMNEVDCATVVSSLLNLGAAMSTYFKKNVVLKGPCLNFETIDVCGRKWTRNCIIKVPSEVPVTYNFDDDPSFHLGTAHIKRSNDGLYCTIVMNESSFILDDEYFVAGSYADVKSHYEGDIMVIDYCRLVGISIIPSVSVSDKTLKVERITQKRTSCIGINEINSYVVNDCGSFVKWWNTFIHDYGHITVADLKEYLNRDSEVVFTDIAYGWTVPISTDEVIPVKKKYDYSYKLNLPDFKKLKD